MRGVSDKMENASNALLIAAGVLMGVLILSLAVYLVVDFGGISADVHQDIDSRRLTEFNTKFDVYTTKDCTIQDVATVAGFAKENNDYYKGSDNKIPAEYEISVFIGSIDITDSEQLKLIQNDTYKNDTYSCTLNYNDNGRVNKVVFKKK